MIVHTKAKVNIGLRVIEKRPDGFHDLETFFISAGKIDILEVTESSDLKMNQYGLQLDINPINNLCVKAYTVLKEEYDIPPVEINLFKRIPFGAGLGGGSSDAAATIIAINKLFKLNLSLGRMAKIASKVGSDCPFFIYAAELNSEKGEGMIGKGRGNILHKYQIPALSSYEIKISVPSINVSTSEAYSGIKPSGQGESLERLLFMPVESWRESIKNDFEETIFKKHPEIEELKNQMYLDGAAYASMSGSGSAVYGLFRR